MSTINLEIYQRVDYQEVPGTYDKPYSVEVKQAFSNGWDIVTSSALFFVNIWPLVIIGGVFIWRRKWLKERLMRKGNRGVLEPTK